MLFRSGETVEEAGVFVKFGGHTHRFELFDAAAHDARCDNAVVCAYNLDNPIYSDITLYAVYEEAPAFTNVTIKYQIFDMDDVVIENVAEGKPIGSKLDGHIKHRDGFRFLGFAKTQERIFDTKCCKSRSVY